MIDLNFIEGEDLEDPGQLEVNLNIQYPYSDDYEYMAYLTRIDFEKEKELDLQHGKGFIVDGPKGSIKKDLKNYNGIYSTRFGSRLGDQTPFIDRYKCECGNLKGSINNGLVCEKCKTICKYVDDDFGIFGWIEIDKEYGIINPDIYKQLDTYFGRSKLPSKSKKIKRTSVLMNIIDFDMEMNQDGEIIGQKEKANEPFYGIGMVAFKERFDEIMEYYLNKNKGKKQDVYNDIMQDRDKVFINSIPVYTTLLRPVDVTAGTMHFEETNKYYNMMVALMARINKNTRKMDRTPHMKNLQLLKFQQNYNALYDEIVAILNGKKGELRNLVSGRFNFTSRAVIKQNPDLRIDQVELPYAELVITEQQRIINILHKALNITYQEAYDKWFKSIAKVDNTIVNILWDIIHNSCNGEGIPVIINRNPTISFGSILQMFCVGINFNYTMSMPLQVLSGLAADFDGDTLNICHIINDTFLQRCYEVFNPRNNMYISKSNGMLSTDILPMKDTLVNANTLNDFTLHDYTEEEMKHINRIKNKAKKIAG